MHLAGADFEVDAPQNLLAVDRRMQIFNAQHIIHSYYSNSYPTLPSNCKANSFCASTANSIGSLASTSRA